MRKKVFLLSLSVALLSFAALIGYRVFFIKMIRVPTGAMANTIIPGDQLVVKRTRGEVKRGDIVVFRYPNQPAVQYISRVVGLPGETIEIRDKFVYVNGDELQEHRVMVKPDFDLDVGVLEEPSEGSGPYQVYYSSPRKGGKSAAQSDVERVTFGTNGPFRIPDGHYFLMGDNRDNSYDSRFQGTVPRELIWGKPTMIYWSSHGDRSHEEKIKWERLWKRVS